MIDTNHKFTAPYSHRNDEFFLSNAKQLIEHHFKYNSSYSRIIGTNFNFDNIKTVEDLPFLHVGLFKKLNLTTIYNPAQKIKEFNSSSTSGVASKVFADSLTSSLQAQSSESILTDFIGNKKRKLFILDSSKSLRTKNFSARIMAAMSLTHFASSVHFLMNSPEDFQSFQVQEFKSYLEASQPGDDILLYGFSWILWSVFKKNDLPKDLLDLMKQFNFIFIHSGGWKKLENEKVSNNEFVNFFRSISSENSFVLDYYGLVEQMGIIYPECEFGYRHVPHWAEIIIRDSWSLKPLVNEIGQIQLLNNISYSSPTQSVLTEDLGIIHDGPCKCNRQGKKFTLFGRIPKAEIRGCSNV